MPAPVDDAHRHVHVIVSRAMKVLELSQAFVALRTISFSSRGGGPRSRVRTRRKRRLWQPSEPIAGRKTTGVAVCEQCFRVIFAPHARCYLRRWRAPDAPAAEPGRAHRRAVVSCSGRMPDYIQMVHHSNRGMPRWPSTEPKKDAQSKPVLPALGRRMFPITPAAMAARNALWVIQTLIVPHPKRHRRWQWSLEEVWACPIEAPGSHLDDDGRIVKARFSSRSTPTTNISRHRGPELGSGRFRCGLFESGANPESISARNDRKVPGEELGGRAVARGHAVAVLLTARWGGLGPMLGADELISRSLQRPDRGSCAPARSATVRQRQSAARCCGDSTRGREWIRGPNSNCPTWRFGPWPVRAIDGLRARRICVEWAPLPRTGAFLELFLARRPVFARALDIPSRTG